MSACAGLPLRAASPHANYHVVASQRVGYVEGLIYHKNEAGIGKVIICGLAVYGDIPVSLSEIDTGHGRFSSSVC